MDEETLRKEFDEWASVAFRSELYPGERLCMWSTWLEATRRADRKAREKCAEICERKAKRVRECNPSRTSAEWAAVKIDDCGAEIRAALKEE